MASAVRCGFASARCILANVLCKSPVRETRVTAFGATRTVPRICWALAARMQTVQTVHTTAPCQVHTTVPCRVHTTAPCRGLEEFFDHRENWGESSVKVGRPWKKDELRLKSNTDLHKLWYVLLMERNMLMTMEAEYKRECELFPNPERFEKVEESMEKVLDVVAERDRAYHLLETGQTGEPGKRWTYNLLGMGYWKKRREHYKPPHTTKYTYNYTRGWQVPYLKLYREKMRRQNSYKVHQARKRRDKLHEIFPDADID